MPEFDPDSPEPLLVTRRVTPESDHATPIPHDSHSTFRARYAAERRRRRSPYRIIRILFTVTPILALLLLAGAFALRAWVHHALIAALPQLDGSLSVPGLSAPVTVRRDNHGVPHIQAASLDDLVLAQGYVTAQDRLWQMDALRRNAAGDLAEILGSAFLPHDRAQRILQVRTSADRVTAALPASQGHWLEQYAAGVNASIADQRDHLPLEFRILRYTPAPWTPRDSMLIALTMFQDLGTSFPEKLSRELITSKLTPDEVADLYPVGSWRDHPPGQTVDLTVPVNEIEQIPLDESQTRLSQPQSPTQSPASLPAALATHPSALPCDSCTSGSNNWALSADHTTTGKPILANDTHLAHTLPGIWYESDLEAPGPNGPFHVAGVVIPGTPFIEIGHNAHLAWGLTVLGGDVQDVYIEHLRTENNETQYQTSDQSWHPILHRSETIHVRNREDVTLDVQLTRHGTMETPIITPIFPQEKRPLSLRWIIYDPTIPTAPFYDVDAATDWPSFSSAISTYGGPTQNLVYADDQGHIAYHAIGKIPLRGTDPAQPQPIAPIPTDATAPDAPTHEWSGYIPFDQLPSVLDPPNGILATANARTTPDSYTLPITLNWAAPYRNERIWKLLAFKPRFSPEEMLAIQTDVYSDLDHVIAQRLAYALDHATDQPQSTGKPYSSIDKKRLHQAADLLRTWNGQVEASSSAAPIVNATRTALWLLLLEPKLGPAAATLYQWGEKPYAEEQLIMHTPDRWLPPSYPNWDVLLTAAVQRGLLTAHAPLNLTQWSSGQAHPVDIEHPIYSQSALLRFLVALPIGTGVQPQSGDNTTIKQVDRTFGPSERLTVDLANPDNTTLNLVLGQSGHPASPWFMDQFQTWLHGTTYPLPFTDQATTPTITHTLTLTPR
jgi:penicillin amidase